MLVCNRRGLSSAVSHVLGGGDVPTEIISPVPLYIRMYAESREVRNICIGGSTDARVHAASRWPRGLTHAYHTPAWGF